MFLKFNGIENKYIVKIENAFLLNYNLKINLYGKLVF